MRRYTAVIKIPFVTAAVASGAYVIGTTADDISTDWVYLAGPCLLLTLNILTGGG